MRSRSPRRVRQGTIIAHLRDAIVRGKAAPGARLPTRVEMARQYRTTVVTVQRALDHLAADGFVRANGRSGTYVTPHPPHLSHYGLVFSYRPNEPESWSGLAKSVRDAAFAIERTESRRLSNYFHTGYEPHKTDDYQRLVDGVNSHTLAGLIFVESPHRLMNTPVVQVPGIPRIAIMGESTIPGVAAMQLDSPRFFDRALDSLRERKRRRVAILSTKYEKAFRDYVVAAVARRGMQLRPYWWQAVGVDSVDWAQGVAHLLLHDRQTERPDALIIADEVLVKSASAGILAAGIRVGQDLDVVAHCNLPRTSGAGILPAVKWLGFDTPRVLHACLDYIDNARRRGADAAERQLGPIPPRFENEPNDEIHVRPQSAVRASRSALQEA